MAKAIAVASALVARAHAYRSQRKGTVSSESAGIAAATAFLDQAGASLHDRFVDATRGTTSSSVTVSGTVVSVIPGISWSLSVTVDAPTERLETP